MHVAEHEYFGFQTFSRSSVSKQNKLVMISPPLDSFVKMSVFQCDIFFYQQLCKTEEEFIN